MWTRIVGGLIVLFSGTYLIQWLVPRGAQKKSNLRMNGQFALIVTFLGMVLLTLSLLEAFRRESIVAWALGDGVGVIVALGVALVLVNRSGQAMPRRESALRATIRLVRTYGAAIFGVVIVTYLAVRIFGSVVEVFIAGALGVVISVTALVVFVINKQNHSSASNPSLRE